MPVLPTGRFILASASPRRLALLQQAGMEPEKIVTADIDETPLPRETPAVYARRIAAAKAAKVAADYPDELVLAADTVVAVGRRILPKAETADQARYCLNLLSGRRHRVLTAVSIKTPGRHKTRLITSVVRFKRLSKPEVEAYLAGGEWHGKAGGYAIQGLAATLIAFISGSYTGIVGLPLYETAALLQEMSFVKGHET